MRSALDAVERHVLAALVLIVDLAGLLSILCRHMRGADTESFHGIEN